MHLRKTTSAGVVTIADDSSAVVTLNSSKRITDVSYGATPTVVAAIPQHSVGVNDLWEWGKLNDNGFFNVIFTNR